MIANYLHDKREWSNKAENACFGGVFQANREGRFPLHQLAEDFRDSACIFDWSMWEAIANATLKQTGMEQRTLGTRPPSATYLHMACKQEWQSVGCQPSQQIRAVELLLNMKADPLEVSPRGDSVLMQTAGCGHVNMFNYLCHRTVRKKTHMQEFAFINIDNRNLWSIAGLAEDDHGKGYNEDIQDILRRLAQDDHIEARGEVKCSSAAQGKKKRKNKHLDEEDAVFPDADGSSM